MREWRLGFCESFVCFAHDKVNKVTQFHEISSIQPSPIYNILTPYFTVAAALLPLTN